MTVFCRRTRLVRRAAGLGAAGTATACFIPTAMTSTAGSDYRSRGFEQQPRRGLRIDLLLATPGMIDRLQQVGIDYDIRGMERPSDHCPVWASFDCGVGVQEG